MENLLWKKNSRYLLSCHPEADQTLLKRLIRACSQVAQRASWCLSDSGFQGWYLGWDGRSKNHKKNLASTMTDLTPAQTFDEKGWRRSIIQNLLQFYSTATTTELKEFTLIDSKCIFEAAVVSWLNPYHRTKLWMNLSVSITYPVVKML